MGFVGEKYSYSEDELIGLQVVLMHPIINEEYYNG
jgi:hypothetical protein